MQELDKLLDPSLRDQVVAEYKEAGLGGERYGVVCPIKDCGKRIAPQGFDWAIANPASYCLHIEEYGETIIDILEVHGLAPRNLQTKVNMKEATIHKEKTDEKPKRKAKRISALLRHPDIRRRED